jgi:hypothetical protein
MIEVKPGIKLNTLLHWFESLSKFSDESLTGFTEPAYPARRFLNRPDIWAVSQLKFKV